MNKLTALYNMMKQIKDTEAFRGTISAEALMDEALLGTLHSEMACAPDHCEKKMELRFGEEVLKFEHQGTEKFHGKMCGPHGHHGHHGHGHGCCGPKGKLGKAMFMLKVLDKTELQELEDGRKVLMMSLTAEDLPNHMKEHMKSKCCGLSEMDCCCGNHEKFQGWLASCGCMDLDFNTLEPQSVTLKIHLNSDCSPAEMNAVIKAGIADNSGKARNITLNINGKHA